MCVQLLSLFSGIGAFEKALNKAEIPFNLVNFSEIDKYAIQSYCAIHGVSPDLNLGDVSKIDVKNIPYFNMLVHGSPCQSFSIIGKGDGGKQGSNTRSSLLWYSVDIIKQRKPNVVIWENVVNVLTPKHKDTFNEYLNTLASLGYTNYYEKISPIEYNVPQNRPRVYVVSILNATQEFKFPTKVALTKSVKDYLLDGYAYEDTVSEELKIDTAITPCCRKVFIEHYENIINSTVAVYKVPAKSSFQDKTVGIKYSKCLLASNSKIHVLNGKRIQKIKPQEAWRLMGFEDIDFLRAKEIGISNTQLLKQAGNSIVVTVLAEIFKQIPLEMVFGTE